MKNLKLIYDLRKQTLFGVFALCIVTLSLVWHPGNVSADSRASREYLIAFDRLFVETGVNDSEQTPREVAMQLAAETEGLSGFEYVPEIGFVATLTETALDTVLVNPDVNMEFGCSGWICTCGNAIDCAWLSWYCSEAGGIRGFDNECYLP